jgi:hypothetical protein
MFKTKLLVVLFLPLLFSISKCDEKKTVEKIEWSENKKLEWNDFKGKPDKNDAIYRAKTFSTISFDPKVEESYIIIDVTNFFNVNLSWSISKSKKQNSQWLLEHEQLHFDISELVARKIRKEFTEYKSSNLNETNNYLHGVYDRYIDTIWLEVNSAYDSETDHGTIRNKQKEWEEKIGKELKKLNKYSESEVKVRRIK